ncbi:MAG: HPF/RaiA family ribosome-associated protein [Acidimicrobiia bacterium]|jgi:ribosomal subunit interface protein|nr:HPF/RaiA family ribosome-associated protein [Acidimicrobiia bacterium]MBP8181933.1 HPF/RaiA family ribosome-associated protein [Acidimicrobiia bacterium]
MSNLEVSVSSRGDVDEQCKDYAREKISRVAAYTDAPILVASVKLHQEPNPAQARPATAEAVLDVNGRPVRAHVAASVMEEAIDLLEDRLKRRLDRYRGRREAARKTAGIEDIAWHHGDGLQQRPSYFNRPIEDRELVRHKTFALDPMSIDEAALDLDLLGHDFYLFSETSSDADAVVGHGDGTLILLSADPDSVNLEDCVAEVALSSVRPGVLDTDAAIALLESTQDKFVFYIDSETHRGRVLYHRYDGHYGLITST